VPWVGKVIDGRYRIREKLGEGGMGSVYKVEHVRIGKVLALKVLRPDLLKDKRVRSRFHQEARIVSRLSTPTPSRCSTSASWRTGPSTSPWST